MTVVVREQGIERVPAVETQVRSGADVEGLEVQSGHDRGSVSAAPPQGGDSHRVDNRPLDFIYSAEEFGLEGRVRVHGWLPSPPRLDADEFEYGRVIDHEELSTDDHPRTAAQVDVDEQVLTLREASRLREVARDRGETNLGCVAADA